MRYSAQAVLLIAVTGLASYAEEAGVDGKALYRNQIRPLLAKNCLGCHGSALKQGGVDLSSREALLRGGENGPVVVPGNAEGSHLYKLVSHHAQPAMPFRGKKLPDEAIALIAKWINAGVPFDEAESDVSVAEETHWAFKKPVRPAVPNEPKRGNPIDAFLDFELAKRKLTPSPEADRRTLIRRIYLDLIGLPPLPEEVQAFLADKSPDAYEKVVDRLLSSPRYGERWGRHWLDIWRYSDWYGWRKENQVRYSQRHVWRWRDWTIEALNANKPYDQMIREMLAGDEIAPTDPNTLRATGYLARNWFLFNRNTWLQDAAEYTATSFMGLTLKCARCHTHKYDPITHVDYYRFRAFFETHNVRIDRVPGEADIVKAGIARVYDSDLSAPTYRFIRGNDKQPETDKPLTPGVPAFFQAKLEIKPVPLPPEAQYPDGRDFVRADLVRAAEQEIEEAEAKLKKAQSESKPESDVKAAEMYLAYARAALPAVKARGEADKAKYSNADAATLQTIAEEARKLERQATILKAEYDLFLANRAMADAKGDEKKLATAKKKLEDAAKALGEAKDTYTPLGTLYPETSSGRRLALANFIASKDNPLTARVAVNHMWLRHFGAPLVRTVFNFGKSGQPPSHPELLDWLAVEFMEGGWDMKRLHRLMVTSMAYRRQSRWTKDNPNVAADPDNVYLWRMNTKRAEAELVRDSLLRIAGKLDTTMGGPEVDEKKAEEVYRRSVYFRHAPDLQVEMLKVFDLANPNECFERTSSIVPQQALALTNSGLSFSVARWLAPQLDRSVASGFERILGRPPSSAELKESKRFLVEQAALYRNSSQLTPYRAGGSPSVKASGDPEQRAFESFVHALLNHNDFVTIR